MNEYLITAALVVAFAVIGMYRAQWVYKNIMRINYADHDVYKTLPTYNYMFARFWIWDFTKFLNSSFSHVAIEVARNEKLRQEGERLLHLYKKE